jgi:ankyrin repeat protein
MIDLPNAKGQTPLHLACLGDKSELMVDVLLKSGAAPNVMDNEVHPSLIYIVLFHCFMAVQPLGHHAKCSLPQLSTPLMYACRKGIVGVVQALIAAGADPAAVDRRGMTAIMHACSQVRTAGFPLCIGCVLFCLGISCV